MWHRSHWALVRQARSLALLTAAVAFAPIMAHADPQGLSVNVPVQVEDAFPVAFGYLELQGTDRFTRDPHARSGSDLLALSPTLKLGALPGLQVDLGSSYNFGNQGSANSAAALDALYNLNNQSTYVPALAMHAYYETPYGAGHKSVRYTLRGIATKWLGPTDRSPRLHLNLTWYHLTQPSRDQRDDQLEMVLGYSQLVSRDTALVLDVVHGAKPERGANQTIVDVGLRHEISEGWAASLGAGAGIGQQSPAFRVFFALQRELRLF